MTISRLNPLCTHHFITIVTMNRNDFFGNIIDGNMQLSKAGIIANIIWNEIANYRDNLIRDEFVVMPNHIHGILLVNKYIKVNTNQLLDSTKYNRHEAYIANIVRLYKSTVKKYTNRFNLDFSWQSGYNNKYIQSESELIAKQHYIRNNVINYNK